ncbi:LOW QUALITY PROTEIN: G kinase-anchoring protein 1-like [Atheta coriaria]|uniref:LOW QUALITY PROTEIN: G kinase-anchoring protein 1-like n=1 Tax=Dalotia coriaria TaxID=877792 RepID=UPI0031F46EE7
MNIVVQSRFACLKSEEEEPVPKAPKPVPKDNANNKNKKDKKTTNNNNANKQSNKKQKAAKVATAKQWEEWKQKDEKLVNGNFEQDLENALMMSKIHYEENKDSILKSRSTKGKKPEKKKNSKKTVSLDEFLAGEPAKDTPDNIPLSVVKESKGDFFEKNVEDVKEALNREKFNDKVRERQNVMDEIISSAQYQEKLEIERNKNEALSKELEQSRAEITAVKERNKTLYTLLSTGEMKGKAEIINELEKLTVIKDELTQEVSRLHGLLEQERSKVAALSNEKQLHKKTGKKH